MVECLGLLWAGAVVAAALAGSPWWLVPGYAVAGALIHHFWMPAPQYASDPEEANGGGRLLHFLMLQSATAAFLFALGGALRFLIF